MVRQSISIRTSAPPEAEEPVPSALEDSVVIDSATVSPELWEKIEIGDPIMPAWAYLKVEIDLALHHTAAEVAAEMDWDPRQGRPGLRFVAPTMSSAVWLQFADAVQNDRKYSRCKECGKWFEVAPDAARTNRRFCSNGCRSKAYRERQDRARRMFAEKKRIEQIAEELDSDVATVRRWITGFKE